MKNLTIVPKDTNYMDFLAKIDELIETSWIFIHNNVLEYLKNSKDVDFRSNYEMDGYIFSWSKQQASLEISSVTNTNYLAVSSINFDNTKEKNAVSEPEDVVFFNMED